VRLSHASPSTAAIFRCVYALPFLGLLAWVEDRRFGGRTWRERRSGLVAGVFAYLSVAFLTRYFKATEVKMLRPFAIYCVVIGIAAIAIMMSRGSAGG